MIVIGEIGLYLKDATTRGSYRRGRHRWGYGGSFRIIALSCGNGNLRKFGYSTIFIG